MTRSSMASSAPSIRVGVAAADYDSLHALPEATLSGKRWAAFCRPSIAKSSVQLRVAVVIFGHPFQGSLGRTGHHDLVVFDLQLIKRHGHELAAHAQEPADREDNSVGLVIVVAHEHVIDRADRLVLVVIDAGAHDL